MMELLTAVTVMSIGALILGATLGYGAVRFRVEGDPVSEKVNALLPQTQCGQCGFAGCKPYAEAVAQSAAAINLCVPGGDECVRKLADLLGRDYIPVSGGEENVKPKAVAVIQEDTCIGCTLCIQACPVDAIVGSAKQMHTVVEFLCTGCELCLKPCPVECIVMEAVPEKLATWKWSCPIAPGNLPEYSKPATRKAA